MKITKRHLRQVIKEEMIASDVPLMSIVQSLSGLIESSNSSRTKQKQQLMRIIREETGLLDVEDPSEIEAVEDVWAGCDDAGNLVLPIDHSKAVKSEPVTAHAEMLPEAPPVLSNEGKIQVYRGKNDLGKTHRIPAIIFERYYDAYVSGYTDTASGILEEHLDNRFPGWIDYEWRS